MIYLDNAATTKPLKEVQECISEYTINQWYNPSALYKNANQVRLDVENARKKIAKFINANSDEIYFTSGATESNNWALRGFVDYCIANKYKPIIITSAIEHKSITDCLIGLMSVYSELRVYEVRVHKKTGFIDEKYLQNILQIVFKKYYNIEKYKILVSVQYANSEIGTIQNTERIAKIVHAYGGIIHTDATQVFGHLPINVGYEQIDMLSASAQKCGGLKGTGILYKAKNCNCIKPLIYGSQEKSNRGGTENVVGIMAMSKAIDCFDKTYNQVSYVVKMKKYFEKRLIEKFDCKINGHWIDDNDEIERDCTEYRLPNNLNVTFPQNITGEALIYMLDSAGIMISSGSACNSRTNKLSPILKAIGLTDEEIMRTIRITIPDDITKEEIDIVVNETDKAIKVLTNS